MPKTESLQYIESRMTEYVPCPHCGDDIPEDATFCRHCGSSESDGWREDTYDAEDDFDYEEFVQNEMPDQVSGALTNKNTKSHWRLTSAILLLLVAFAFLVLNQFPF